MCREKKHLLFFSDENADETSCQWMCCGDGGVVFVGFAVGGKEPFGLSFRN